MRGACVASVVVATTGCAIIEDGEVGVKKSFGEIAEEPVMQGATLSIPVKEFELQQAQKDAQIEVARARGAAESQRIIRETLSDSYLQYLWIQTLNQNPNVIYVATEATMPIFKPAASGKAP